MSLSVGDVLDLAVFVKNAYDAVKGASREYREVLKSLGTFEGILMRLLKEAERNTSILVKDELMTVLRNSHDTLWELRSIVTQYHNMGAGKRIAFCLKDLNPLRNSLAQHHGEIMEYLQEAQISSLGRIESQIQILTTQSLKRSGTVMTKYENDDEHF